MHLKCRSGCSIIQILGNGIIFLAQIAESFYRMIDLKIMGYGVGWFGVFQIADYGIYVLFGVFQNSTASHYAPEPASCDFKIAQGTPQAKFTNDRVGSSINNFINRSIIKT